MLTFAPPPCLALISPQLLPLGMDIELHPSVSLTPDTFSVLVAPGEVLAGAINSHPELQRYKTLFICGNYSRILSTVLDVRRAFTVFQLMTILEESHHSLLIVEHDPLLYEDAERRMVEYLAQALKQASREATVLLYALAMDPHLQKIAGLADRVFCIYSEPAAAKGRGKAEARVQGTQRTLGAYS